jgi:hypothetical protein
MVIIAQWNSVTPRILLSVFGVVGVLWNLKGLICTKIVIDNSTQTITIGKRSISFSEVRYIVVYGNGSSEPDKWWLSLDTGEELNITDNMTKRRDDLLDLAHAIKRRVGSKLVEDPSGYRQGGCQQKKRGLSSISREEAIARWRDSNETKNLLDIHDTFNCITTVIMYCNLPRFQR